MSQRPSQGWSPSKNCSVSRSLLKSFAPLGTNAARWQCPRAGAGAARRQGMQLTARLPRLLLPQGRPGWGRAPGSRLHSGLQGWSPAPGVCASVSWVCIRTLWQDCSAWSSFLQQGVLMQSCFPRQVPSASLLPPTSLLQFCGYFVGLH